MHPNKKGLGHHIEIEKYNLTFKFTRTDEHYYAYKPDIGQRFSFFSKGETKEQLFSDFMEAWEEDERRNWQRGHGQP